MKLTILQAARAFILVSLFSGAGPAQSPSCGPYPGCLYIPPITYSVAVTTSVVTYTDVAGLQRSVPIAIRRPVGKPTPLPVVIWIHGGGEGLSNPLTAMNEWGTVTAQAGYLSVAGAHEIRTSRNQLCTAIGIPVEECAQFPPLTWDRPSDVTAIVNELFRMNAQGPLEGQIDVNRIAVGGHSAGSAATMSLAGARRILFPGGPPTSMADRRPVAFIGLSPQGPGHLGFFETDFRKTEISWDGVTRPAMIATGDGDARCYAAARDACEDTPMLRRIAFDRMRPPDKYLMYINDARTFHNIFAMKTSECAEENVPSTNCQAFASWLVSSVLAFLDSYIEQRLTAETWLRNSFLATASGGVAQLERQ